MARLPESRGIWQAIVRRTGRRSRKVTGYVEVFFVRSANTWATIPGVSRFVNA